MILEQDDKDQTLLDVECKCKIWQKNSIIQN